MSGSFYSLNTQYNTLLAILEDINQDKLAQDLENVLVQGNDAAGLNMTNVGAITVDTLNYTTLNPAVPEVIGNISQVLAVGNDATNQSITNMGSVAMKAGGGGSITYADGTVQSTAYTGSAGGDQTIQQVLAEGSDAGGQQISNILGLSTGSVATNPNNALTLLSLNTNNINLTAFPTASASSGQVVIQTQELGGQQNNWYFTNNGNFNLPQGGGINYPSGSGLDEFAGQIDLTAVGADLNFNATGVGDINLNSTNTKLGGTLTFPDASVQTTAFTGSASTPSLSQVLAVDNSAEPYNITKLSSIAGDTYFLGDGGGGSADTYLINEDGGNIIINTGDGITQPTTTLNINKTEVSVYNALRLVGTSIPLEFSDGTIQTTAFTGSAATPNLSTVLTAGNSVGSSSINMNQQSITNPNQISTLLTTQGVFDPSVQNQINNVWSNSTTQTNNYFKLGYLTGGKSGFPRPTADIQLTGGLVLPNAYTSGELIISGSVFSTTTPSTNNYYTKLSQQKLSFYTDIDPFYNYIMPNVAASIESNTALTLGIGASNFVFNTNGSITFPDSTIQTTAYTGGVSDNLTNVLTTGNNAGNLQITNLAGVAGTTYFIGDVGNDTFLSNGTGGSFNFYTGSGGGITQSTVKINQSGMELKTGNLNLGAGKLTSVQSIVSDALNFPTQIKYTDGTENGLPDVVTLLGSNIGTVSNYSVGIGDNVAGSGTLSTNAVGIGRNAGYYGIGQSSVAIGQGAGSQPSMSSQTGQGTQSVAIGLNAGASGIGTGGGGQGADCIAIGAGSGAGNGNNPQISGAVAIGSGAGGYGMNANSVAIGYAAGKGTLASVPQGQNSIAIGAGAGAGFGSAGVPANSLTLSSMRTSTTASNLLTYNTTTKEVSNVAALNIDPTNNRFAIGSGNTGLNAGNGTFASGIDTGKVAGANCYASGISSGNNTGGNQTSIGIAAGNNSLQSVCIGLNAGNGTFNATCIGNSAGSVGLGDNSVAIGTNASPTNGAANSICIVGDGTTINPPNNGLFISPIRSAASATNQLTYNTTTKEIQYAPSGSLTYAQATFTNLSINNGIGNLTFTSGAESLFIPTAGTWQVSGWYRLASSVSGSGLQLNGSSFYMATQSGDAYQYGQLSSHFYNQSTSANTSLTFTHTISYTMTTAISLVLTGRITTGGFNFAALNGQGEFYAVKLA